VLVGSQVPLAAQNADPIAMALARSQPTQAELRWRLVPWMRSLRQALAAGSRTGKPVFYFGYDGILDTGNS